ncbi:MAG: hypothetical protein ABH864_03155 [archaeon]
MKKGESKIPTCPFSQTNKRGLATLVQVVIIVVIAIVLAAVVAVIINETLTRSGSTIDAQRIVLDSEFSITSVINSVDDGVLKVGIRRERGAGAYPTVIVYSPQGDYLIKSYQDPLSIYQTTSVTFLHSDLVAVGVENIVKAEVYATALDTRGEIVNSRNPKDVRMVSYELLDPPEDCGDGFLDGGECDDGNSDDGDGCSAVCTVETGWYCTGQPSVCTTQCDDGIIAGSEVCDDGEENGCVGYEGCDEGCSTLLRCGNGVEECSEECDDGNSDDGDACVIDSGDSYECRDAYCGDSYIWDTSCGSDCEECDEGEATEQCTDGCMDTYCGDGVIQDPNGKGDNEICDGSALGGATCENVYDPPIYSSGGTLVCDMATNPCIGWDETGCTPIPTPQCGDGDIDLPEEACDDGFNEACDGYTVYGETGCSLGCLRVEECGNGGTPQCWEECDDGNDNPYDTCNECINTYCGDGYAQNPNGGGESEECDDGNSDPTDECNNCEITSCGDGIIQQPNGGGLTEECDNGVGNTWAPGGCRPLICELPYCGDGVCDPGEGSGGAVMLSAIGSGQGSDTQPGDSDVIYDLPDGGNCPQDCGGGGGGSGINIGEDFQIVYDHNHDGTTR